MKIIIPLDTYFDGLINCSKSNFESKNVKYKSKGYMQLGVMLTYQMSSSRHNGNNKLFCIHS